MTDHANIVREIVDARGNEDHTPEDYDAALAALDALVAERDGYATVLGNLKSLAEAEIESNPALGIPGYRKGMLARATVAALGEDA